MNSEELFLKEKYTIWYKAIKQIILSKKQQLKDVDGIINIMYITTDCKSEDISCMESQFGQDFYFHEKRGIVSIDRFLPLINKITLLKIICCEFDLKLVTDNSQFICLFIEQ